MKNATLDRSVSLPTLILYGTGTIIGAGIYVLVGKVAGYSGLHAPFSFIIAGILAAFTALSYAELSSRMPVSASEVKYIDTALHKKALSIMVGLSVTFTAIVSTAALAKGFSGYFSEFFDIAPSVVIISIILIFGGIAIWGIKQSMFLAVTISILEIIGLIFVIIIGADSLLTIPERLPELIPSVNDASGLFLGAFLAFFAFIGFEDMSNVAEEVKNPKRTVPIAIISALIIATILYIIVSLISVLSLPLSELAETDAPLSRIVEHNSNFPTSIISVISLIAITNGIIIQIIMASRILYGMGKQKLAPSFLSKVNSKTRTPIIATLITIALALIFALALPITSLANTTSYVILIVFTLVNLSLWVIKTRKSKKPAISIPFAIPIIGFFLNLSFLIFKTTMILI